MAYWASVDLRWPWPGSTPCTFHPLRTWLPQHVPTVVADVPMGKPNGQAYLKPSLTVGSLTSHWPKQITWPCPPSTGHRRRSPHHLGGGKEEENICYPTISSTTFTCFYTKEQCFPLKKTSEPLVGMTAFSTSVRSIILGLSSAPGLSPSNLVADSRPGLPPLSLPPPAGRGGHEQPDLHLELLHSRTSW